MAVTHLAMIRREFEQSLVVGGHHEDLYEMPKKFDARLPEVRAALDGFGNLRPPLVESSLPPSRTAARAWARTCGAPLTPTLPRRLFFSATVALQMPLSPAMRLHHTVGQRISLDHIYDYDDEVYLAEDVTDVQASMLGVVPIMLSFSGMARDAPIHGHRVPTHEPQSGTLRT